MEYWRGLTIGWILIFVLAGRTHAQDFGVGFRGTPDPALVGVPVTFQISLTNRANRNLTNVLLTAVVNGPAQFVSATNQIGSVTNIANTILFGMEVLTNNTRVTLGYTLSPTAFGEIRHALLIESADANGYETNFVTRIVAGSAALGASFRAIPSGALSGDLLAYQLSVTNRGPNAALGVQVIHTLPSGLTLLGLDPPGQNFIRDRDRVILPLGVMTNGAQALFQFRVQPSLSGALPLTANVFAPGFDNPGTNSQANASLIIASPGPGQLVSSVDGPQIFNPQSGLMEQRVVVANVGSTPIAAARVLVNGLTNWLYNAAGTNQSTPFVVATQSMNPGTSVELMLQYFNPTRQSAEAPALSALDVPVPGLTRPDGIAVPSSFSALSNGFVGLEFSTVPGRRYAVLYGTDARLANGAALPVVVASGSRLQWVDYGLPLTAPPPEQAPSRLYQVIEVTFP